MRWEGEAETAAAQDGWTVVDRAGISYWQGWGALLLRRGDEWAGLQWSYGSCSGCDAYEGQSEEETVADLKGNIRTYATEEEARRCYTERGW